MKRNIFAKGLDEHSLAQIEQLNTLAWCRGNDYAVMPDTHAGRDCLVGLTMKLNGVVDPRWIGADIGCGVMVAPFLPDPDELIAVDSFLAKNRKQLATKWDTPLPTAEQFMDCFREKAYAFGNETINTLIDKTYDELLHQLGTLGGGNHFIEVGKVWSTGDYFVTVHTGSRHFGQNILNLMLNRAETHLNIAHHTAVDQTVKYCKENGEEKLIEEKLSVLREAKAQAEENKYVIAGAELTLYLQLQSLAVDYATASRAFIIKLVEESVGVRRPVEDRFVGLDLPHNYIDIVGSDLVLHKGTIKAPVGTPIALPLNMRDGVLMARSKGNPDALNSCPHGAGRVMSRKKARSEFTLDDFKEEMTAIRSSSVCVETLDEHPNAYKRYDYTLDTGIDLYEPIGVIKPVFNFKCF